MRAAVGTGRQRLLEKFFDTFGEGGPSPELSTRQVAEELGVHHTLLTYHFGSRQQMLAAVLNEARRRDYALMAATDGDLGVADLALAIWEHYSDPSRADRVRAFFYVAGLAIHDPDSYQDFTENLDELAGLVERAARRDGHSPRQARRLSLQIDACIRGLLLQRLLSDDAAAVDDAARSIIRTLGQPAPATR